MGDNTLTLTLALTLTLTLALPLALSPNPYPGPGPSPIALALAVALTPALTLTLPLTLALVRTLTLTLVMSGCSPDDELPAPDDAPSSPSPYSSFQHAVARGPSACPSVGTQSIAAAAKMTSRAFAPLTLRSALKRSTFLKSGTSSATMRVGIALESLLL